jgi:hypothetical protein
MELPTNEILPFTRQCQLHLEAKKFELCPLAYHGNPRTHKLIGKDILSEFEWYEQSADSYVLCSVSEDRNILWRRCMAR